MEVSEGKLSKEINKHRNVVAMWRLKGLIKPVRYATTKGGAKRYMYNLEEIQEKLSTII